MRISYTLLSFFLLSLFTGCNYFNHPTLPLYDQTIPCKNPATSDKNPPIVQKWMLAEVNRPEMEVYQPAFFNATQTAIIICPGGGYSILGWEWEGTEIAKWLSRKGITAFVLKYRLPVNETINCKTTIPLTDAKKAIELIRNQSKKWSIDPQKIGIMGFSAGGHLAASLSCHFEKELYRPNFSMLLYPVLSMTDSLTNIDTQKNLLGPNPSDSLIHYYSLERQVKTNTPPTIIIHSSDDSLVPLGGSLAYFQSLMYQNVPAAMHIFDKAGHNFSKGGNEGQSNQWRAICEHWLEDRGLL